LLEVKKVGTGAEKRVGRKTERGSEGKGALGKIDTSILQFQDYNLYRTLSRREEGKVFRERNRKSTTSDWKIFIPVP